MRFFVLVLFALGTLYSGNFTLVSDDLGGQFGINQEFNGFGCSGKNISPALRWADAPTGTKSFAVTMYDPDAPTGSGWWHWIVYNIPATTLSIGSNASGLKTLPYGSVESVTSYGIAGFGGACPPKGDEAHRYIITVYALDVDKLDLPASATPAMVGYNLNAHAIQKSAIISYYGRK